MHRIDCVGSIPPFRHPIRCYGRGQTKTFPMLFSLIGLVHAEEQYVLTKCQGMYATKEFPSGKQAYIDVQVQPLNQQGHLAMAIFRYEDRNALLMDPFVGDLVLCRSFMIDGGVCVPSELGKFHVLDTDKTLLNEVVAWGSGQGQIFKRQANATVTQTATSTSSSTTTSSPTPTTSAIPKIKDTQLKVRFNVDEAGYYCFYMTAVDLEQGKDYNIYLVASNSYGYLPAIFYPTLPFFSTLSIVYLIFGSVWMYLSFRYWKDLLLIQHYVSGVIAFLLVEMACNYGFYEDFNKNGRISGFLLALVVLLNAGRTSLSFFMLLIVSLGYGVVKHTLGDTMKLCIYLGLAHFVSGALYGYNAVNSADASPLVTFFLALPVTVTMGIFYFWILSGLEQTMKHLEDRRQQVKLTMYKRLQYILGGSVFLLFLVVVANSINASNRNDPKWIANQWKWRWMLLDGSVNIIYFLVFALIVVLWRPTENNERYGLDQLATEDPDEFEVITDNQIKLRNIHMDEEETADDILNWVEQHVGNSFDPPSRDSRDSRE
ncbi:lung seven transmembrane receptor-domain-containing protein [Gorgonomyces haynaldii]|nr:lung seven transmembrane receptor-domain-containing protein [Gorgonomyces haynaldii]